MEEISTFIEILERAGIKYEVDQAVDNNGHCYGLDVYVYDDSDSFAVFAFGNDKPVLNDFKIIK